MTNVDEILQRALKAVEDADVPEDLREAAFTKSFDLLAQDSEGGNGNKRQPGGESDEASTDEAVEPDAWDARIATRLEITTAEVREVYEKSENGLDLIVPTSALDDSIKAGVQELAHLISVGRQAMGLEEATSTKVILPIAEHYGKKDKNFAANVDGLDQLFVIKRINRYEKTLKARAKAFEKAGALVKRILEEPESQ